MNQAGKERAESLAQKEYSLIEYRNRLVRMQNMDCICHCSAEIDMGTLLYFSVNDLYLGQGNYVVLLFSESSDNSQEQNEGRDVFGRMFTYAVIEEVVKEVLTGHYSFYSSELDGRLAAILTFPFGLLPDRSIVDYLDENCREISRRCRSRYGMDVITYIGDPIDNIRFISGVYSKLLETATLRRYTDHHFEDPVFHVFLPEPTKWKDRVPPIRERARELVSVLLRSGDYHAKADETLQELAQIQPSNVDSIKRTFGDYFEGICAYAREMGVKIPVESLRNEQFKMLFDSVQWAEPCRWLHNTLDAIYREFLESSHKKVRRQLDVAMEYIQQNLSAPGLTVDACAEAAGCSTSALSKLFRRQMNVSVAKYIRKKRLEKALILLKDGESVGDSCEKCGFGSTETFHRAFKEEYGITPGQIRGNG